MCVAFTPERAAVTTSENVSYSVSGSIFAILCWDMFTPQSSVNRIIQCVRSVFWYSHDLWFLVYPLYLPCKFKTNLKQNRRFKLILIVSVVGYSAFHKLPSNTKPRRLEAFAYQMHLKLRVPSVHLPPSAGEARSVDQLRDRRSERETIRRSQCGLGTLKSQLNLEQYIIMSSKDGSDKF